MRLTWHRPPETGTVADGLTTHFHQIYGHLPDGIWSAPGRVNLIGEHTDYNGGYCLPFALPHRTYAAVSWREDGIVRIGSRQRPEGGWEGRVSDIRPGTPRSWPAYVAGVLSVLAEQVGAGSLGMDILVDGHVPVGAGLSSSAALSCSVGVAVRDLVPGLAGLSDDELIRVCIRAENDFAGAATGGMDQTVSILAVQDHLLFLDTRAGEAQPVAWTLADHVVLVSDTRAAHALADGQYAERRATCERAAQRLGVGLLRELGPEQLDEALGTLGDDPVAVARTRHVVTENQRVLDLVAALAERDERAVGRLMTASHTSLRDDYEVSCHELDVAVEAALEAGALGARMTGGGFGGSAIALVRRGDVERIATAVARAFDQARLAAPAFLLAEPGGPAARER